MPYFMLKITSLILKSREARRFFQEAKSVFAKWARMPGCYGCKVCGRAECKESPILVCDHCCHGIHQCCFLLPGSRVLSIITQVSKIEPLDYIHIHLKNCKMNGSGYLPSIAGRYSILLWRRLPQTFCGNQDAFQATSSCCFSLQITDQCASSIHVCLVNSDVIITTDRTYIRISGETTNRSRRYVLQVLLLGFFHRQFDFYSSFFDAGSDLNSAVEYQAPL